MQPLGGVSVEKGVLTSQDWMVADLGVQLMVIYPLPLHPYAAIGVHAATPGYPEPEIWLVSPKTWIFIISVLIHVN